ncbi:MAG: sulfatase-like hydrolase/transferase, partial [Rhodospirillaceae bacterium]|nr:sulfatase-like hydrolase/transferase [Rhodospirillaceae bacterium]
TPELDRLAAQGMRFTDFYAGNAVCSPARAVLLTGKSATNVAIRGNAGFFGNDRWEGVALDRDEFTLGEMMKGAGYQTAFVGKWHLDNPDDVETWAWGHGFDYAVQEQWSARFGGREFPPQRLWVNGDQEYVPYDYRQYDGKDHFRTDFAFEFLESMDRDRPFFLFMSYRAPHSFEGPLRDTELYADRGWPEIERVHAAKITLLDRQVGRLLNKLKEMGELDNTLVLFTSDNGAHFAAGGHDLEFFDSNGVLRGGKRDLYEGGVRVPLIAYWQGRVEAGATTGHISAFQDLMPTFADIAGIETPEQSDGISFLPLLLGEEQREHESLNWEIQLSGWFQTLPDGGFRQSARMGEWKAARYGVDSATELYNLNQDISESNDVADDHPEIVETMNRLFESARTDTPGFPYGGVVQHHLSQDRYQAE